MPHAGEEEALKKNAQETALGANIVWTLVRVYDDEGATGLGESFRAPGLSRGDIHHDRR